MSDVVKIRKCEKNGTERTFDEKKEGDGLDNDLGKGSLIPKQTEEEPPSDMPGAGRQILGKRCFFYPYCG